MDPQEVWVCVIGHRHGEDLSVHASEGDAYKAAADYAAEWWDEDGPGRDGEPMPEDPEERSRAYFDSGESDWCDITPHKIEGATSLDAPPPALAHVHTVEVFGRDDGVYVFSDARDAARFEAAVNRAAGGYTPEGDEPFESACIRRWQTVCDAESTDILVAAELGGDNSEEENDVDA